MNTHIYHSRQWFNIHLFHRLIRTAHLYKMDVCRGITGSLKREIHVQSTVTAAVLCDGRTSVLNHCLSWSKFVNTHLSHSRQWFNIRHTYLAVCWLETPSVPGNQHSYQSATDLKTVENSCVHLGCHIPPARIILELYDHILS